MAEVLEGVTTRQTVSLWWVQDIADIAAPTVSELEAATSVKLECLLVGQFSPDATVEKAQLRRMCEAENRERNGAITRTIGDLTGVYDPQDLSGDLSAAYAALATGATGYLVVRWGIHVDTAPAAAQNVDVYACEIGTRSKVPAADNDELQFKATVTIVGQFEEDVALAA